MMIQVSWGVMLCSLVSGFWHFKGSVFETSESSPSTLLHHIPEDLHLHWAGTSYLALPICVTHHHWINTNLQKAESQLAYELQAAKIRQKIRNEEIQIEVVERRKQIEIEEQEVQRKERELNSTVRLPAEAESYRVQMVAEGKRCVIVCFCWHFIHKLQAHCCNIWIFKESQRMCWSAPTEEISSFL